MTCRYDPEQDARSSALIVGLCLSFALLVVALGMIYRGERAPILPPEPECWDVVKGEPCDLRPQEPRARRNR